MEEAPPQGEAGEEADPLGRIRRLVRAERIRYLYDRLGVSQATVVLNSAVVAVAFWGSCDSSRLLAWLAAVWAIAASRLLLGVAYRRSGKSQGRVRWERRFTAGAAANGLVWGAAALLLLDGDLSLAHALFLAFVLGGMAAGSALSNASHPPAFFAFAAPALVPITVVLVAGGEKLHIAMGLMMAVFGVAVSAISRAGGRSLEEAVRLRYQNAELAERVLEAAAELEARVKERTGQLEAALSREREAERRLAQASRLASLGTLAAGVAHEINNPLAYVQSSLAFVREELTPAAGGREPLLEAVREAAEGAERVRVIVRQLTDLSRVQLRSGLEPVDLHAALDGCIAMAGAELRTRARVVRSYGAIPEVMGEPTRLVQVFLNLLLNAAEAIPEGSPETQRVEISTRLDGKADEVVVEVTDTGKGIPAELLERIWAPFFTTHSPGRGAGLGLPICKSLVASLGGRISVRSQPGAGTTFTVVLRAARPVMTPSPR